MARRTCADASAMRYYVNVFKVMVILVFLIWIMTDLQLPLYILYGICYGGTCIVFLSECLFDYDLLVHL